MNYVFLAVGIIIGAGGYYLYDKYAGSVMDRIKALEAKAAALRAPWPLQNCGTDFLII